MKIHFLIIIVTAVFNVFAQVSNARKFDKQIINTEKERRRSAEKQEKERLRKPTQIEIDVPAEDLGELLVNIFEAANYKVDQKGRRKISMSMIPAQINTQTDSDGAGAYKLIIGLDEAAGKTKVTINIGMPALNAFGKIGYVSLDSDKKTRADIEEILSAVKEKIENGNS